ncbi:unnamed protein product [Peniophora sp. CBMAI 1063]|nr:unnamed protein product [Peniophora sp. CBMAI 1063]
MATEEGVSAEDIAERVYQKLSASQRRPFAPSKEADKVGDGLWDAYLDAVEDDDKASVESWNGSTTGILTFTGLFAATVAAFVLESYKQLQPDTGAQTVALLAQIASASSGNSPIPSSELPSEPFVAPESAVIVNSLWFLSLIISLICALLATLIQEWTRDFLRDIQRRTPDMTIKQFSFNHIYVRMGVERYKLGYVTSLIVFLMHIAVILFVVGLAVFLAPIHYKPTLVIEIAGALAASVYLVFSLLPFWDNSCPYRTPLTYAVVILGWAGLLAFGAILLSALVVLALPLFILATMVLFAIYGFSSTKPMKSNSPSAPLITFPAVYAVLPAFLQFFMYAWLPARRLPGHNNIPMRASRLFRVHGNGVETQDGLFIDKSRFLFLWDHTYQYITGLEGSPILLDHLVNQLMNFGAHNYDMIFVYLRHSASFTQYLAKCMRSIPSLDVGLGMLNLFQRLIDAEHAFEHRSGAALRDGRWGWMSKSGSLQELGTLAQTVVALGRSADTKSRIDIVMRLFRLRRSLIDHYIAMGPEDWAANVGSLDTMLHSLESVQGFDLIQLYSRDSRVVSYTVPSDSRERRKPEAPWAGYDLAIRNALTTLVNLIGIDPNRELSHDLDDMGIKALFEHTAFTKDNLSRYAAFSRKATPSPQLLALFCSRTHGYGDELALFVGFFTVPAREALQVQEELEAEQTLRDMPVVFPAAPFEPEAQVMRSILIEDAIEAHRNTRADRADDAQAPEPSDTGNLAPAFELQTPLPTSPSEFAGPSLAIPDPPPDVSGISEGLSASPVLRSAEEGHNFGLDGMVILIRGH